MFRTRKIKSLFNGKGRIRRLWKESIGLIWADIKSSRDVSSDTTVYWVADKTFKEPSADNEYPEGPSGDGTGSRNAYAVI